MADPGTLYVVATPIGNLEDITRRAVRILGCVDVVLAEDTRRTGLLLRHLEVPRKPLIAYHEHNEAARTPEVLALLREGKSCALLTDAGTPCAQDPGVRLVRAARGAGVAVVPVPGPSAILAALMASGAPTDRFQVVGFLPRKPLALERALVDAAAYDGTTVAFEAPHRLLRTLEAASRLIPRATIHVAREMTKVHETFEAGTAADLLRRLGDRPVKGEVTLLIDPREGAKQPPAPEAEA